MKKTMQGLVAFVLFSGTLLCAQEIAGSWQGTLHIRQRDERTIVKIEQTDRGDWSVVINYIDHPGYRMPATSVSFQDQVLKYSVAAIKGSFEGKTSADGRSIAGTWKQGPDSEPLVLSRATPETAWTIPDPPRSLAPMAADAVPHYEVSTVKPADPAKHENPHHSSGGSGGHVFRSRNTNLIYLITFAYGLQARQVVGAPAWFEKEPFDVDAKMVTEGQPNDQQIKRALQMLLEDRFKLTYHYNTKTLAAYEIIVDRGGPKNLTMSVGYDGDPHNEHHTLSTETPGVMIAKNSTLQDLGNILGRFVLDKPVVDHTGITDRMDFSLYWTPDESQYFGRGVHTAPGANADEQPDLFTAIRRQLGLRLQPVKGPIRVMVVDHAELPSGN